MNRYEFCAVGYCLFGQSWKKDLTRLLHLSESSRTVDKIANGDKGSISVGMKDDLIIAMKHKTEMLNQAIRLLESPEPEKIVIAQTEMSIVSFDVNGVQVLNVFEEHGAYSKIGILLNNAIINMRPFDYEFQSLIIAQVAEEALKKNDRSILIQAIQDYFDLSWVGRDDWYEAE